MRKPFFLVRVSGESMWPSFVPGKHYAASGLMRPRVEDDIVARNPHDADAFVIKKITAHRGESWELNGTVPWSSSFTVAAKDVVGVVLRSRFRSSRVKRLILKEEG